MTRPIIWNPSMKKFVTLPKPYKRCPKKRWKIVTAFLGYDPIEGKHKVVCMPGARTSGVCRVLTLGSAQESWRTIKTNLEHCPYSNRCQRCIKGVIYCRGTIDDHSNGGAILMSFDVRTEKFDMINLPSDDFSGLLILYKGKLACVNYTLANDCITMWVLEDAEKHSWSRKHFLTTFARSLGKIYRIDGATDAGELICVPLTFLRSFFILYFDPERNSLRRVEFKGIADYGFRFGNGLGDKRLSWLHTFSNHIDTLM